MGTVTALPAAHRPVIGADAPIDSHGAVHLTIPDAIGTDGLTLCGRGFDVTETDIAGDQASITCEQCVDGLDAANAVIRESNPNDPRLAAELRLRAGALLAAAAHIDPAGAAL
jgi:hypothetical protein